MDQLSDYPYLTYQYDDQLLHFAEEAINVGAIDKIVYLEDRGNMINLLSCTDGYNLGNGCIVKNFMHDNITAIPLKDGNLIQVGILTRQDRVLSEDLVLFIDLLKQALVKAAPKT
ncbi:MAG: hypothetical protein LBK56_06925 [Gracilibacteraceae bacterium]|nr:hypothetical protein [Gracilibacteraceae bacterium]